MNDNRPKALPAQRTAAMAPLAASTQSRNKLQAFQFDQENTKPLNERERDGAVEAENGHAPRTVQQFQHASQQNGIKNSKECPQTPVGRLPLAELITIGEETIQAFNLTPVERVLWQTRDSEHGSSQETPALTRSRKRAHSSSPVSSSQKRYKTPTQFTALERSLKTPQADPATELWRRYSLNAPGNKGLSPTRAIGQPFLQLMNSSSPETPAQRILGREYAGLRRSFSCGAEWPTSAAKRRKTQHVTGHHEPAAALVASQEALNKSQASKSRLSLLVAKIQEGLARPASDECENVPTSSHKSLCHGEQRTGPGPPELSDSETRQSTTESPSSGKIVTPHRSLAEPLQDDTRAAEDIHDLSSEFGDDELDIEALEAAGVEAEAQSTSCMFRAQHSNINVDQIPTMEAANAQKDKTTMLDGRGVVVSKPQAALSTKTMTSIKTSRPQDAGATPALSANEFDEDANDTSIKDLGGAFATHDKIPDHDPQARTAIGRKVDEKPSQQQSTEYGSSPDNIQDIVDIQAATPGDAVGALSEDEFGDDLDFEQIVAECDKATQGDPTDPQLQASVRIREFGAAR